MSKFDDLVLKAASFAARVHQGQFRKDGKTPYVSHVVRVCLITRSIFNIDDPKVLATALLHDTIEDTTVDRDDLIEEFGADVAGWVAALSKDMRLQDDEREAAYINVLSQADWPVIICKLADIYDNSTDTASLNAKGRQRTLARSENYYAALASTAHAEAKDALAIVRRKLDAVAEQSK